MQHTPKPLENHQTGTEICQEQRSIEIGFSEPYEVTHLPWIMLGIMLLAFVCTNGLYELGNIQGNAQLKNLASKLFDYGLLDKRLFAGEVWRLLTVPFLHVSCVHIAGNAATFLLACYLLRTIYAGRAWLWIFIGSNIAGAIIFTAININLQSAGASIGIAGMVGAMISSELLRLYEKLPRSEYPARSVISHKGLVVLIVFQALIESLLPNVGHSAHLAGLVAGFLMGFFFARNGKLLIVTGSPDKARAEFPAPVKSRGHAAAYPFVELKLRDDFDVRCDYLGFINVTRGGIFYRKPRLQVICGPLTEEIACAAQYRVLGTQYPPQSQADALERQYKELAKADKAKNRIWTVAGVILGVVGGYFAYNNWFFDIVLDAKDYGWLKTLPLWLAPIASQILSHAGAALLSFMTAHTLSYFALKFLQRLVQGSKTH